MCTHLIFWFAYYVAGSLRVADGVLCGKLWLFTIQDLSTCIYSKSTSCVLVVVGVFCILRVRLCNL